MTSTQLRAERALREGKKAFEQWRGSVPDFRVEISSADFSGLDFSGYVFGPAVFRNCTFRKANFTRTDLSEAEFINCSLNGTVLDAAIMRKSKFNGCSCESSLFKDIDARDALYDKCDFRAASFDHCAFHACSFQNADFVAVRMRDCKFESARFHGASFVKSTIVRSELGSCDYNEAVLRETSLDGCSLSNACFVTASLSEVEFARCNLRGSAFGRASVRDCKFFENDFDSATTFKDVRDITGTSIPRLDLLSLTNYGGLTPTQRLSLNVVDDVAKLRRQFSGYRQWVHLACITLFMSQYVAFVGKRYFASLTMERSGSDITILWSLMCYIINGTGEWRSINASWSTITLSLLSFIAFVSYNAARLVLLVRTKEIEWEEVTTEVPSRFSFGRYPGTHCLFQVVSYGVWLGLLSLLVNTLLFLMQRTPVQ